MSLFWYRVASGMQMVAKVAAQSATSDLGRVSLRASQHTIELISRALPKDGSSASTVDIFKTFQGGVTSPAHDVSFNNIRKPQIYGVEPSLDIDSLTEAQKLAYEAKEKDRMQLVADAARQEKSQEPGIQFQENQILANPEASTAELKALKEGRSVPSTRFGRAFGFAQLGVGIAVGTASEGISRLFGGEGSGS
eukprot:CAMPEP_0198149344 /NCGR_PEP_ID=MMETSP1443-20131203/46118_1 /TAXON_ID=186043 /ORGANISM="Entomoneis sp., Strain CCMP2396" /LENGTH=193 /DNA_ID=CAMNT_0043814343 /DNA_START=19 /DNA_END=597 /DNA_ORIENTATION=-